MRILCLGGTTFTPQLRELGHTVKSLVPPGCAYHTDDVALDYYSDMMHCADAVREVIDDFGPDVLLQGDRSKPDIHLGIGDYDIPKIWYAIDTHLHFNWHSHYAPLFDTVLCAQQNLREKLLPYQPNTIWLPLYCESTTEFARWNSRIYEASFVGNLNPDRNPQRCSFFEALKGTLPSFHPATGAYAPVYSRSRVVVNQSVHDDLNLRFFEAAGCGALVVTDRLSHSMNDILVEGEDYLSYEHGNVVECSSQIRWALENPSKAEGMARNAHEKVLSAHTAVHRAKHISDQLCGLKGTGHKATPAQLIHLGFAYEYCSRLAYPPTVVLSFQRLATNLAHTLAHTAETKAPSQLLMAMLDTQTGNIENARTRFKQLSQPPAAPHFRRQYYITRTMAFLLGAPDPSALDTLSQGLREFPSDPDLLEIKAAFCQSLRRG